MKMFLNVVMVICFLNQIPVCGQKAISLSSPNGNINFKFRSGKTSPAYDINFKGKPVLVQSPMSLSFDEGEFKSNLQMLPPLYREADEKYVLTVGKTKAVNEHFKEVWAVEWEFPKHYLSIQHPTTVSAMILESNTESYALPIHNLILLVEY